jgi:hypothetical protein
MQDKTITQNRRATVYTEGKLAYEEHEHRTRNPYAANNLVLAVSWWHGWDTAEEESIDPTAPNNRR